MKKTLLTFLIISVFFAPAAKSEVTTTERMKSNGFFNGEYWNLMVSDENKIAYLSGFYDGIFYMDMMRQKYTKDAEGPGLKEFAFLAQRTIVRKQTYQEIISEIDKFYSDPKNLKIAISFAYVYVAKKIKGATESQLKNALKGFREAFK